VLSCFDRVVITGTLPAIAHAGAMTGLLGYLGIRVFDYTQWAEPLREALRANAERLAPGGRPHHRVHPPPQGVS